jgi:glutaconate CoA-transferase, subunit B
MNTSAAELMVIAIARRLRDGWTTVTGVGSNIPLAASILARSTHAPSLTVISGGIYVNPAKIVPDFCAGSRIECEHIGDFIDVFQVTEIGIDVMFYSGMQIDKHGSINLHEVKTNDGTLRGPGLANTAFGHTAAEVFLWTENHDTRTLVNEVDFVTVFGQASRQRTRQQVGLENLGPTRLFTPRVEFRMRDDGEFSPELLLDPEKDWRDTQQSTGWPMLDEPPVPLSSQGPIEDELRILRENVDPLGVLR